MSDPAPVTDPDVLARFGAPAPVTDPDVLSRFGAGQSGASDGGQSLKKYSRVIGSTDIGLPIFEDPNDTMEMMKAFTDSQNKVGSSVLRGLRDPVDAGAQLLTRSLEALAPSGSGFEAFMKGQREHVEDINKNAESEYQAGGPPSPDIGRAVGGMVATAPVAYAMPGATAAKFLPRLVSGAASGGTAGALQPINDPESSGDFWKEKGLQTGVGAAIGAPLSALGAGIPKPAVNPNVQRVMGAGVTPTPGQIIGGSANRIEEALQSVPLLGDAIKSARRRAVGDFNTAAINEALAPIGKTVRPGTAGHDAIVEAADHVSSAYDNLLPSLRVQADPQFVTNVQALRANAQTMHPDRVKQFDNIIQNDVIRKFSPGGGMTGEGFKEVESKLGRLASDYGNSVDGDQRQLGGALRQMQAEMRDMLSRSNPQHAGELSDINSAYSGLLRVQGAAARIGSDQGVFTPAQLLSSVRQLDPTLRKSAFAKGSAPMQDLADAGKSVLGDKVPDSGTPLRSMVALGALGPAFMAEPLTTSAAVTGGAGLASLYTRPGQSMLAKALTSQPSLARRLAAPPLATLPAALMGNPGSQSPP